MIIIVIGSVLFALSGANILHSRFLQIEQSWHSSAEGACDAPSSGSIRGQVMQRAINEAMEGTVKISSKSLS